MGQALRRHVSAMWHATSIQALVLAAFTTHTGAGDGLVRFRRSRDAELWSGAVRAKEHCAALMATALAHGPCMQSSVLAWALASF